MEANRPRLKLPWTFADRTVEFVAALGAVFLVAMFFIRSSMPERVPTHFGFDGRADAWGDPSTLLVLSGVALAHYVGLTLLSRVPHVFNYPWPITAGNAPRQYILARRLILVLKAFVVWLFVGILIASWRVAAGSSAGLTPWFLVFVAGFIVMTLALYFRAARKAR